MKTIKISVVMTVLLLGLTITAFGEEKATVALEETKNQTHCPVIGGKIDSTVFTDIQGQRVYHCCPMCSGKLKADPDSYFKKAAADGILFENIQTTCPISGMELKDKSISLDFEGRQLAFCSDNCRTEFQKKPAHYLKQMDAGTDDKEKPLSDKKKTGHEGHNH